MADVVLEQTLHAVVREAFAQLNDSNEPDSRRQPFANMAESFLFVLGRLLAIAQVADALLLNHVAFLGAASGEAVGRFLVVFLPVAIVGERKVASAVLISMTSIVGT
jgi:hypothetical protein